MTSNHQEVMEIGYVAVVGIGKDYCFNYDMRDSVVLRHRIFRQQWHAYRAHVLDFVGRVYDMNDIIDADIDIQELKANISANYNTEEIKRDAILNWKEMENDEDMSSWKEIGKWVEMFDTIEDEDEYMTRIVRKVHVCESGGNSLFTIIIQTAHGEEALHNDLMFTRALADDESSIFHLVLNSVFLTLRNVLGTSAPKEVRDMVINPEFNLQNIMETNSQILKRCNIPDNIRNTLNMHTLNGTRKTIHKLQDIIRSMTMDLFPNADGLSTEYLLTVATNLSFR